MTIILTIPTEYIKLSKNESLHYVTIKISILS